MNTFIITILCLFLVLNIPLLQAQKRDSASSDNQLYTTTQKDSTKISKKNQVIAPLEKNNRKQAYDSFYKQFLKDLPKKSQRDSFFLGDKKLFFPDDSADKVAQQGRNAWILADNGYTPDIVAQISREKGINIIEEAQKPEAPNCFILFSEVIIRGKVDSLYNDKALGDGCIGSFAISVKEVLKGNITANSVIIRTDVNSVYYSPNGSKFIHHANSDGNPPLEENKEYIIFLSKADYEQRLYRYTNNGSQTTQDSGIKRKRQMSFLENFHIPTSSLPFRYLGSSDPNEENKIRKEMIDKTLTMCKDLKTIFQKMSSSNKEK
jgi:hypothetical protein